MQTAVYSIFVMVYHIRGCASDMQHLGLVLMVPVYHVTWSSLTVHPL